MRGHTLATALTLVTSNTGHLMSTYSVPHSTLKMCELHQSLRQPIYHPPVYAHKGEMLCPVSHGEYVEDLRSILFGSWFITFLLLGSSRTLSPHTRSLRGLLLSSGFRVGDPKTPRGCQSWLEPWRTLTLRRKATVPKMKRSKELP